MALNHKTLRTHERKAITPFRAVPCIPWRMKSAKKWGGVLSNHIIKTHPPTFCAFSSYHVIVALLGAINNALSYCSVFFDFARLSARD